MLLSLTYRLFPYKLKIHNERPMHNCIRLVNATNKNRMISNQIKNQEHKIKENRDNNNNNCTRKFNTTWHEQRT